MSTASIPHRQRSARHRASSVAVSVLPFAALAFACLDSAIVYGASLVLQAFGAR